MSQELPNVGEGCNVEYAVIGAFYGNRTAKRSGVPLIAHIDEGLAILDRLGASDIAKRAFCLHPIIQNVEPVEFETSLAVLQLAEEYRDRANAYLCVPQTDYVRTIRAVESLVGPMSIDCAMMLRADKEQNRKNFLLHHAKSHPRSARLQKYFDLWLAYLDSLPLE